MLKGLRTVIYKVDGIAAAKEWCSALLGFGPYFDQPFYVGFNVGGYELGLDPDNREVVRGDSPAAYWGVDNIETLIAKLSENGLEVVSDAADVGGGIKVGGIKDPFGNHIGLIENPHFKIEK